MRDSDRFSLSKNHKHQPYTRSHNRFKHSSINRPLVLFLKNVLSVLLSMLFGYYLGTALDVIWQNEKDAAIEHQPKQQQIQPKNYPK
jgi:hypothetical protein